MPTHTTAMMLNKDGSAYHLRAFPEDIADTVIFVGDPERAAIIANYFDRIELRRSCREFVLITGSLNRQRISVMGTGIGTGNIDIVINELDMLVNFDLREGAAKEKLRRLKIIRLGTSGALQPDIPIGSFVLSAHAFALDGLLHYYSYNPSDSENAYTSALKEHFSAFPMAQNLYFSDADKALIDKLSSLGTTGMTFTCCGFYGPQHRQVRAPLTRHNIAQCAQSFNFRETQITNFEMETAAIYGLGKLLGHHCCSINAIVANRVTDEKHPAPQKLIKNLIERFLALL